MCGVHFHLNVLTVVVSSKHKNRRKQYPKVEIEKEDKAALTSWKSDQTSL